MLAERGVNVGHPTLWIQRYAPEMKKRLRWYSRNLTNFIRVTLTNVYEG